MNGWQKSLILILGCVVAGIVLLAFGTKIPPGIAGSVVGGLGGGLVGGAIGGVIGGGFVLVLSWYRKRNKMSSGEEIAKLIQSKKDDILRIAELHGASNIRIFGSTARGEAQPDSDIDFLVDLEQGRSLMDHAALLLDLEELLGRKVDVATEAWLKDRVRGQVLAEAVPL